MKFLHLLFLLASFPMLMVAQDSVSTKPSSILERINQTESGKGSVKIIQDESISERIGRPVKRDLSNDFDDEESKYVEMSGWRIQVFSGNNQRISKKEAFQKEMDVKTSFPELSTYVKYDAPFWRLRAGDFQTLINAQKVLVQLRHTFPAYGREMSIVKERIQVKVK